MINEKFNDFDDPLIINFLSDDIMNLFSADKTLLTKNECKNILNIIFEGLFDEKLKNKNFNYIFDLLSKNNNQCVFKNDLEPIIKALVVCFDVNYITNSSSFNDKV